MDRSLLHNLSLLTIGVCVWCLLNGPQAARADRSVDALVDQLGAMKFRERIAAEQELLKRGAISLPAVLSATESDDPEIRLRALRLLEVLQQKAFAENREALLKNPWTVPDSYAPGWELFHAFAGDGADARTLYAQILEQEPKLMLSLAQTSAEINAEFEQRCADLKNFAAQRSNGKAHPATVATLLLVSLHPDCQPTAQAGLVINNVLNDAQFSHAIVMSPALRSLLEAWVMFDISTSAQTRLHHAANFKLKAGLAPAREIAMSPPLQSKTLTQHALFFLAMYGGHREIDLLESKLNDETELYTRSSNKSIEVRDVALLGLLHLTEQDYKAYNFDLVRNDSRYLYRSNSGGFSSEQQRDTAFRQWEQWRRQHPKVPVIVTQDAAEGEVSLLPKSVHNQ